MPIQSEINSLSTSPGSNSPAGSEPASLMDDYLRSLAAHIATLRDQIGTGGAVDTVARATADSAVAGLLLPTMQRQTRIRSI